MLTECSFLCPLCWVVFEIPQLNDGKCSYTKSNEHMRKLTWQLSAQSKVILSLVKKIHKCKPLDCFYPPTHSSNYYVKTLLVCNLFFIWSLLVFVKCLQEHNLFPINLRSWPDNIHGTT